MTDACSDAEAMREAAPYPGPECPYCECVNRSVSPATVTEADAIERVAQAIYESRPMSGSTGTHSWEDINVLIPSRAEVCRINARAALAAAPAAEGWRRLQDAPSEWLDGRRLILGWQPGGGFSAHIELGWYREGWRNTYGRAFHGDPTHLFLPPILSAPQSQEPR